MKAFLLVFGMIVAMLAMGSIEEVEGKEQVTGFLDQTVAIGGHDYDYVVYLPREYEERESWPVILFLHGLGESGTDGLRQVGQGLGQAILRAPERWPFVVIFPQKPGREEWENHEEAVMVILEETERNFRVDPERRYLTGLSQGGHGTMVFGAKYADLWAAIAPICGYPGEGFSGETLRGMPIWCFHGDADTVVPVERSAEFVNAVREAGASVEFTIYPGVGHNSWDRAYAEEKLPGWFLSHRKTGVPNE